MTRIQLCIGLVWLAVMGCQAAPAVTELPASSPAPSPTASASSLPVATASPSAPPVPSASPTPSAESTSPPQTGQQATQTPQAASSEAFSRYDLRALPWGNLFYQLNCLAGQGFCSLESYQSLWQQQLQWTAADQAELVKWQALRSQYSRQISFSSANSPRALPPRFEGLRSWDKVTQAALNAQDKQTLAQNLALAMRPQDAEALMAILDHFEPRFRKWWQNTGEALSRSAAQRFLQRMQQDQLAELVEQASRFYQAELTDNSVLSFNFLARPNLGPSQNVNGEQLENQSLIEIRQGASLDAQLAVVIHELCHYLFKRSSTANEALLLQGFTQNADADTLAAYNLLDEVLATAIGNGLVNQRLLPANEFSRLLETPRGFYNDAWIDPLAKALYPRLEQALQTNQPLHSPAFIQDYLRLARETLGPSLQSPVPLLRTLGGAYEPSLASSFGNLQQALRAGVTWSANGLGSTARSIFTDHAALSGVLMLRPQDLGQLSDWDPILGAPARQAIQAGSGPRVYGVRRAPAAYVFVFVADTPQSMNSLVTRFLQQPQRFEGLMP